MQEKIIILDFGSQYTQLIARRLRELNTYCEILPYNKFPYGEEGIKGVILSGSPYSVNDPNALFVDLSRIRGVYPVLGVCYGAQFLAHTSGGKVESADTREYGRANLAWHDENDPLMRGVRENSTVWMSHGDSITVIPSTFTLVASTHEVKTAAFHIEGEPTWGVQFHPEVYHSEDGTLLLTNFVRDICHCDMDWTPASFIEHTVAELSTKLGDDKVVLALSGGVDSTVAAVLLNKAIGNHLTCIFVDNGLLRKNEFESVLANYKDMGLNVLGIDAKDYFYEQLTQAVDIPIINLVEETAEQLAVRGARKVGILATTGVHQSGVLAQAIRDRGIEVLLPDPDSRERLMYIIYKQIKAGRPADLSEFEQIAENMLASGADCLVLGCTELPLLKREPELAQHVRTKELLENDCLDVLEVLAKHAIINAGAKLKK